MIFAKIDFINLLPFHIFLKKNIQSTQLKSIIQYKKSYPSLINKKFKKRKVHSAFISSIASRNEKNLDFGIVAKKDVLEEMHPFLGGGDMIKAYINMSAICKGIWGEKEGKDRFNELFRFRTDSQH